MNIRFNDKVIAKNVKTAEDVSSEIKKYMNKNGIKGSGYVRYVALEDKLTMIDYGSHINFFYVDDSFDKVWPRQVSSKDDKSVKTIMSRKELFDFIKENHLQEEIFNKFKKNFTNVSSEELNDFIDSNKNRIYNIKATIEQRKECNQKIINALVDFLNKYPDIRFCQALVNIGIDTVDFNEESQLTLWKVNSVLNKRNL